MLRHFCRNLFFFFFFSQIFDLGNIFENFAPKNAKKVIFVNKSRFSPPIF